ncbi:LysR family transcriptional regulator [Pseudomonas sp. H3(2019)]|uniref:LysR family transcriptional regulator n=1 Tax=Pseudomonas sp. H3(2019) TaxID=2598724 RepID=UPI0011920694|nr:LysR family transcriptional regulator [Pseudomonas sp. H3(2019)]TVT84581.1 LysR family transcriptional regulator [Pseudomonas sp. H3(2019)]
MMNWQDLHHFVVVARLGSFTAAGKELRVDHATVGRRITALETSLGMKLVERLPRSSRLTEDGLALAAIAMPMEAITDAIGRHARGTAPLSGTVRLSALPILASALIAPSLTRLRSHYPALKVILSAASGVASLEKGESDVAIGFVRPETSGRIVRKVGSMKLGLYASPAYALRPSPTWTFIGFEEALHQIPQQRWIQRFADGRPFVLQSSDVATQLAAARAGIGVAILPCFLADRDTALAKIELDDEPTARDIWMSVHADVRRSPAVRVTMDHLIDLLGHELG